MPITMPITRVLQVLGTVQTNGRALIEPRGPTYRVVYNTPRGFINFEVEMGWDGALQF
jgi:hypothetical protein